MYNNDGKKKDIIIGCNKLKAWPAEDITNYLVLVKVKHCKAAI